jgi:hypothetical protein
MKRNDILWKSMLEDIFDDFLRFFFVNAEELFDLERGFEYLDKELEQLFPPEGDKCSPRYVDKLVKVYSKSGLEEWVLVHIEVQGYRDHTFADRMFTYYYRIWDKHRKPVSAFAILTDDCQHYHPCRFDQECLGTSLCFRFSSYKVLDQSEEELGANDNPFAQAVLATKIALIGKKLPVTELYRLKIDLAKRLLTRKIPKRKIGKLMEFLKFYVRLDNDEFDEQFDLEIDRIVNQTHIPMTFEEAILHIVREEAKEKQETFFVTNMLSQTDCSIEDIARLVGVSIDFVREVRQKLISE